MKFWNSKEWTIYELIFNIYTEGKRKRRVNILGDLNLFIRMFFSVLIYKDKNTNLINKFLKFH